MTANALACKQSVANNNNNNETKRCKIETELENRRRWLADFRDFDQCVANNLGLDQTWRGRKQSAQRNNVNTSGASPNANLDSLQSPLIARI